MKLEYKVINFDVTTTIAEYSDLILSHRRDGWRVCEEGKEQVWSTTLVRLLNDPLSAK
jgi:hypothetical protein